MNYLGFLVLEKGLTLALSPLSLSIVLQGGVCFVVYKRCCE